MLSGSPNNQPATDTGDVRPPEWLRAEAVEVWQRLAPDLQRKSLLTAHDADAFAVLCDAIVQYQQASKLIQAAGVLIKGPNGAATKNPAMQLARDAAQTIRTYAQEFGLTPSARSTSSLEPARGKNAEHLFR